MPNDYSSLYQSAGNTFNVDPLLAQAVAQVESNENPNAMSRDDQGNPVAYGTMQLTAPNLQRLNVPDPYNPQYNIPAGTRMLDEALTTANGDVPTALRIYEGGPDPSKWGPQNAAYPAKVAAAYQKLASAQKPSPPAPSSNPSTSTEQPTPSRAPDAIDAFLTGGTPAPAAAASAPPRAPDAIDDFLTGKGAPPPAPSPVSSTPVDEFGAPVSGSPVAAAISDAKAAFGSEPVGLPQENQDALAAAGVYNKPGENNPLKSLAQAVINPLYAVGDAVARGAGAAFHGAQGYVAQSLSDMGYPVLGRDIAGMPEAFMGDAGTFIPHGAEPPVAPVAAAPEITQFPVTPRSVVENAPVTVRPSVANDAVANPLVHTPSANAPAFVPPGAKFPPAPQPNPLAAPAFVPPAAAPRAPGVVVTSGDRSVPATNMLQSTGPSTPVQAVNDVSPRLATPANDAEANPAWNYPAQANPLAPTSAPVAPPRSVNPLSSPVVPPVAPEAVVQSASDLPKPPQAPIDPATTQTARAVAAARATDEMARVMAPAQQGLDTTTYVPGVRPTAAELTADPELAIEQKRTRIGNEEPYVEAENANNIARSDYFSNLAGTPDDVARLQDARAAQAQNDLSAAFANKGTADAQPVVNTINSILASPDGVRPLVQSKLSSVLQTLYDRNGDLQTDPEMLYGARKNIDDMLSKEATKSEPLNVRVASTLQAVKGALDQAIEPAAPGFDKYLANFAEASKPIDTLETLQSYQPKLTNGPNRMMTFGKVDSMMRNIVADRAAPGINPAKSIDPDTMNALFNLHADLRRAANADQLAKAKGSDTAQLLQYGKKLGVTAAHGVAAHTMPVIGNALVHYTQDAASKALLKKRIDSHINPNIAKLEKKYGAKRNPLQAPPADTE